MILNRYKYVTSGSIRARRLLRHPRESSVFPVLQNQAKHMDIAGTTAQRRGPKVWKAVSEAVSSALSPVSPLDLETLGLLARTYVVELANSISAIYAPAGSWMTQ